MSYPAAPKSERFDILHGRRVPDHYRRLEAADDPAPRVRFQAAFTLGQLNGPDALAALSQIARHDAADFWIRSAILTSVSSRAAPLIVLLLADPAFGTEA